MEIPSASGSQPTGGGHRGDRYAWGLALSPLLKVLVEVPLALAGFGYALALLVRLGATVALVIADRRELTRSNRPPAGAPAAVAWFLIPEIYLFKRARRLGRPQTLFWAMLGCEAATFALGLALIAATVATATQPAETGPVLPGCDATASTDDVLSVFSDIQEVRAAGLRGVVLTNRTEFAQGPGRVPSERICEGTIEASDTKRYDVMYGFEIIQGRVIVRVALK